MNETQKNWRKAWEEYEPTEHDKIYRNYKNPKRKPLLPWKKIVTAVLVVALYFFGSYVSDINARLFGTQDDFLFDDTEVVSNRNGILRDQNIARINKIFEETENKLEKEQKLSIASYIEEIEAMDLSMEYEDLKKQSIEQLQEAKDRYDEIDINALLMEAFAQAGVEYSVDDDGSVEYIYYEE